MQIWTIRKQTFNNKKKWDYAALCETHKKSLEWEVSKVLNKHQSCIVLNIWRSSMWDTWCTRTHTPKGAQLQTQEAIHTYTKHTRHAHKGCLHLKEPYSSEVCQRARERTTAEINQVKRGFPPPYTHTHSPESWPLKESDRWVFFFSQVPADSCPGYREVRWTVCVRVGGAGRRSKVKKKKRKNWSTPKFIWTCTKRTRAGRRELTPNLAFM